MTCQWNPVASTHEPAPMSLADAPRGANSSEFHKRQWTAVLEPKRLAYFPTVAQHVGNVAHAVKLLNFDQHHEVTDGYSSSSADHECVSKFSWKSPRVDEIFLSTPANHHPINPATAWHLKKNSRCFLMQ